MGGVVHGRARRRQRNHDLDREPGPRADILLIAGLSDPAEAWQAQLDGLSDRYRVITFDNRGSGRTPLPDGPMSVAMMADDAAELLPLA
ncbi:alpha/beta fold hydrolase [Streptomyces swartbergensis]|uniref:alpha/beta fold hydrolase n=1 Tax=Streptomyces swartbergensis TaxID=487165 RepID=UPI001FC98136|nr:hypothetical protein [Streptomyces swartbergensis]